MSSFIHLHCHTEYSLLDGAIQIPKLIDKCKSLGMTSVAVTDNGVMYGAIEFYLAAKANGIKPIIGCELTITPDIAIKERAWDRLILLAKDYAGYQNLIKLVTIANLDGFYYKPRIDLTNLAKFSQGLFVISPGLRGLVASQLQKNQDEAATVLASRLKEIYGSNFYLGIQSTGQALEEKVKEDTLVLSEKLDIPIVATNDVYYLEKNQANLRNILMCIQTGKLLEDNIRAQTQTDELYFKSADQMAEVFQALPQALENAAYIAEQCNLELETERVTLPNFKCPDNKTSEEYLTELSWAGLKEKYSEITPEITERINFELSIISKMGYAIYFLIICDFLSFCRKQGIPVGPGRGSAAGSIVAYALNITNIDPLPYKLLFERFLNPERVSMPDIDLDFCIKRRNEVFEYLVQKYGSDHVSQIVTFGTMAARGVIRDVGRVLGVPLADVDRIAKLIPAVPGQHISIPEAIEQVPELKKLYNGNAEYKNLLDLGTQLEGSARHTSVHAAGVVISNEPLDRVVPLIRNDNQIVTQYPMNDLEKLGLLKMDILGLRNLTVIADTLHKIKDTQGLTLDLNKLDLVDQPTYDLLCQGLGIGVFQLEGRGMRDLMKRLKPQVFEDLIALLALYRPGPLGSGMVDDFISNKSGQTKVKYEIPELEPILKDTYGMIVYQEQVMQIASVVSNFSLGQADMLRRAMGKKKKEEMDKMKTLFLEGAVSKGVNVTKAEKIFELCYKFAEYGFNKSHSAAYALISYQTAYLKAHFTKEYFACLISSVAGNSDKISLYTQECKALGIEVLAPEISRSLADFRVEETGIRFGLNAIKNVGEGAIESIIKNRPNEGYSSLFEFCQKVDLRQVNKRVIEALIKSGAMDIFGQRNDLLSLYEQTMDYAQNLAKEKSNGQISLFSNSQEENHLENIKPTTQYAYSKNEFLRFEKELIGIYLTGHPLDILAKQIQALPHNTKEIKVEDDNKQMQLIGILSNVRKIINKNRQEMVLAVFEDLAGELPLILMQNKNYEKLSSLIQDDTIVQLQARIRVRDEEISLYCEDITLLDANKSLKQLHINVEYLEQPIYKQIRTLLECQYGEIPVHLHFANTTILAHKKYWLVPEQEQAKLLKLQELLGPGSAWITNIII